MIIYDINAYIQEDTDVLTEAGVDELTIFPAVGYETDVSPIITYFWFPGIMSVESFFINVSRFLYRILDTDSDRAFRIGKVIIEKLNKADTIQGVIPSDDYVPKWCYLRRSDNGGPMEREGYYFLELEFEIGYVTP